MVLAPTNPYTQADLNADVKVIDQSLDAIVDILDNWTEGKNVSRLVPGMTPFDLLASRMPHVEPDMLRFLIKLANQRRQR